jgi:hypothetical protein
VVEHWKINKKNTRIMGSLLSLGKTKMYRQ